MIVWTPEMRLKVFQDTMLDIRESLEGVPCSAVCDSFGICDICAARFATYQREIDMRRDSK